MITAETVTDGEIRWLLSRTPNQDLATCCRLAASLSNSHQARRYAREQIAEELNRRVAAGESVSATALDAARHDLHAFASGENWTRLMTDLERATHERLALAFADALRADGGAK